MNIANAKGPALNRPDLRCTRNAQLISSKLECTLRRSGVPGAGQRAIVRTDVFKLAVCNKMSGGPLCVFSIGFDMDGPFRRIQSDDFERIGIRTRIDNTVDGFAVPAHFNRQVIPLCCIRTPVSVPDSRQWMSFLSKSGNG